MRVRVYACAHIHLLLSCGKNKNAVNHRCPSVRDIGGPRRVTGGIKINNIINIAFIEIVAKEQKISIVISRESRTVALAAIAL